MIFFSDLLSWVFGIFHNEDKGMICHDLDYPSFSIQRVFTVQSLI